jgi:hypothetical protein
MLSTLFFTLLLLTTPLFAQNTATATITATVHARTLTITKTKDLAVTSISQGETKTITPAAPEAAAFTISGLPNTKVNITFSLPSYLTYTTATLPLSQWRARISSTSSPDNGTDFTSLISPVSYTLNPDGLAFLFIGATISASNTQLPGTYPGS